MASALTQDSAAADFRRLSLADVEQREDASSPFPSPGSSFFPPPRLGAHEFAAASSSAMRTAARSSAGAPSLVPHDHQAMHDHQQVTPTLAKPATLAGDTPSPVTPTQSAADDMGALLSHGGGSSSNNLGEGSSSNNTGDSSDTGGSDTPPPPPQITIPSPPPTPALDLTEPPPSPSPSLTSSRPAPPSPAASRRTSAALSRRSSGTRSRAPESRRQSRVPGLAPQLEGTASSSAARSPTTPTAAALTANTPADAAVLPADAAPPKQRRSLVSKIRDFAFPPSDERHVGRGADAPRANRPRHHSSSSSSSASASAAEDEEAEGGQEGSWGTFRWNTFSQHVWGAGGPSQTDLERNFGAVGDAPGPEGERVEGDEDEYGDEDEDYADAEAEGPLLPGLYRALFAFEPEGTAEMALEEEQLVRVVGRGGGVGWAVVVREGDRHALVPESYLELVEADA